MDRNSRKILVHFVARHGFEAGLEKRLRELGFDSVRRLTAANWGPVGATKAEFLVA